MYTRHEITSDVIIDSTLDKTGVEITFVTNDSDVIIVLPIEIVTQFKEALIELLD